MLKSMEHLSLMVFLVCTMLATGLKLTAREMLGPLRDFKFVTRMLVLNFLLSPGLAFLITRLIPLDQGYAIGLLLLSGAAGAPFLPNLMKTARGNLSFAVAAMVLLTAGTILFLPLAMPFMVPGIKADPWGIARPLLLLILLPLAIGMLIRTLTFKTAEITAPVLAGLGTCCLLLLCVLLIIQNAADLFGLAGSGAVAATVLHMGLLLVAGWFMGGQRPDILSVICLGTGARNFGAAFVPAESLDNPKVSVMITVGAIVALLGLFPTARWIARHVTATTLAQR